MEKYELEIEAYGRVQGVGFRVLVKRYADKNKIRGFIVNRNTGGVMIVVQGEKNKVENVLGWLQSNPGLSKIESLKYVWRKSGKIYEDFKIVKNGNFFSEQARNFYNLGKYIFKGKSENVPKNIAIIPDGNRRWAKGQGLHSEFGHYKAGSIDNILSLLNEADKLGVRYISFWGFSTENWKRSEIEREAIFNLILEIVAVLRKDAISHNFRFRHIGRKDRLPKNLLKALKEIEEDSKDNTGLTVQLCLDYGGKDEIIRAINKILKSGKKRISENDLSSALDTNGIPEVDLIIRTSGEQRTSGFMPYQAGYAELYFTEKHFPDFKKEDLRKAVEWYGDRERRFGGNSK